MTTINLAILIACLPEDKLIFVINILENIGEMSGISVYPNEVDEMIYTGAGEHFSGSTADFFLECNTLTN